jgi:hypothetical protein
MDGFSMTPLSTRSEVIRAFRKFWNRSSKEEEELLAADYCAPGLDCHAIARQPRTLSGLLYNFHTFAPISGFLIRLRIAKKIAATKLLGWKILSVCNAERNLAKARIRRHDVQFAKMNGNSSVTPGRNGRHSNTLRLTTTTGSKRKRRSFWESAPNRNLR